MLLSPICAMQTVSLTWELWLSCMGSCSGERSLCCSHRLCCPLGPCTQRRYARLHSYRLGFTTMVPSASHRQTLTKNKGTKRSVKSQKSICVFPECLKEKLPTVKGASALLFRKAIHNCPPTWMGPGNVCFDELGWMFQSQLESCSWKQREGWTFCNNRSSRDWFPVNSSCPLFMCIYVYLDAARESVIAGQAQENSNYTRKNSRGRGSGTAVLASWSWKKVESSDLDLFWLAKASCTC